MFLMSASRVPHSSHVILTLLCLLSYRRYMDSSGKGLLFLMMSIISSSLTFTMHPLNPPPYETEFSSLPDGMTLMAGHSALNSCLPMT